MRPRSSAVRGTTVATDTAIAATTPGTSLHVLLVIVVAGFLLALLAARAPARGR